MPSLTNAKRKTEEVKEIAKDAEKTGSEVAAETKKVARNSKKAGERVTKETKKVAKRNKRKKI